MQNPNFRDTRGGSARSGLLAAAAALAAGAALLRPEIETLQEARAAQDAAAERLDARLDGLADRVESGRAEVERAMLERDGRLERRIEESGRALDGLRGDLAAAFSSQGSLAENLTGLRDAVQAQAAALALDHAEEDRGAARVRLREAILDPVFQLSGAEAVGSAVLVHEDQDERGVFQLALTSYHVVRDILGEDGEALDGEIDGFVEREASEEIQVRCRLLARDLDHDLALLRVEGGGRFGHLARIAPLEREGQIDVFSPVYAVGCPLGTAAQATRGELTRKGWKVGGAELWMISSPAYFGNSGGGVFLADTQELIGVFAKIYTHGSYRPQVVTHMGLAVPLRVLHEWLEREGYGYLLPGPGGELAAAIAAPPRQDG